MSGGAMRQEISMRENGQLTARRLDTRAEGIRELLEEVRLGAVRLLSDLGPTPRTLRLRAGEIAVEVEWDSPGAAPAPEPESRVDTVSQPREGTAYLTAPTVGVFYRAPEEGAAPFVREGDPVRPGQQVGIVEAMKLMIPVEADRAGRITGVLKANAEPVEFGERLFEIVTEDG